MRNLILIACLALPLSGCLVAGAVGGVIVGNEVLDNRVHVSHIDLNATTVWNTAKDFLSKESAELIEFDDQTRIAKAKLDDRNVIVSVEAYDVDQCKLTVSAKKFMSTVNDGEFAGVVMERLQRRLNEFESKK